MEICPWDQVWVGSAGESEAQYRTLETPGTPREVKGLRKQVLSTSPGIALLSSRPFHLDIRRLPSPQAPPAAASEVVGLYCSQEVEWLRGPRRKQNDGQNSGKEEFSEPVLSLEAALIATFIICLL